MQRAMTPLIARISFKIMQTCCGVFEGKIGVLFPSAGLNLRLEFEHH